MSDAEPQIAGSLIDLIGDTPLLRLNRVTEGLTCTVAAKLEMLNPGGSVKDRPALAMITQAEDEGLLGPAAPSSSPPPATPAWAWPSWPPSGATAASSW